MAALLGLLVSGASLVSAPAFEGATKARVVLLGAERDHPEGTHEYLAGLRVLQACLERQESVEVVTLRVDQPQADWGKALRGASCIVGFFYGEKVHGNAELRGAIEAELARGAGLVMLHRALQGDGEAGRWIQRVASGYHGEKDRKYQTLKARCRLNGEHAIARGLGDFEVEDEFYYRLKFAPEAKRESLVRIDVEGVDETVGWGLERKDGGRSFGFSGGHFHRNFALPEYRRLLTQAVLWASGREIAEGGVKVDGAGE